MKSSLIIMAKVPEPGSVKTRLQPCFTPEQSKSLATCFLKDAESKAQMLDCQSIIAFSPVDQKEELGRILQYENTVIEQSGKNLGMRMLNAIDFAFQNGFDSVVLIGTDCPTLRLENIKLAFKYLERGRDAVIGETEDGGFYLIGLKFLPKGIFDAVDWSTNRTFNQTVENIQNAKVKLEKLEVWYDVDLPKDVERLRQELAEAPQLAPATSEWLMKN